MKLQHWPILSLIVAAACSSPTGPSTGAPTPTPGTGNTGGVPALRTFTASPATVTQGDEFTLTWEGENGTVSLAAKGGTAFIFGLPSSGSYVVRSGANGYPAATGATTYEAAIGDVAKRLETTVTVNARTAANREPTVSVSASPTGCHPRHLPTPPQTCSATCSANASDPDGDALSYAWSGCATGSNTTATCTVDDPGNHSCTVTVTDGKGGSATASATVQGTNAPPVQSDGCWSNGAGCSVTAYPRNWACAGDAPTYRFIGTDPDETAPREVLTCSARSLVPNYCAVCSCTLAANVNARFYVLFSTGAGPSTCTLEVTLSDDWGATDVKNVSIPVI